MEIRGRIVDIELIATNLSIRELARLKKLHGSSRWRKLKGKAFVVLQDGTIARAEVHWYEAHGIGRRQMKIKRFLDEW